MLSFGVMLKWRLDPGQIEVVDDAIADILRRKTPAQRTEMIFQCNETMRLVIEGSDSDVSSAMG